MKNQRYIFLLIISCTFLSTSFAQLRFPGKSKNAEDEIRWLNNQLLVSKSFDKKVEVYLGLGQVYSESRNKVAIYYFNNAILFADSTNDYNLRYGTRYKIAKEYEKNEQYKESYDKIIEGIKLSNDNRKVDDVEKAKKFSEEILGNAIIKVEQNIKVANALMNSNNYKRAILILKQTSELLGLIHISKKDVYIKKVNELSDKIQDLVIKKIEQNIQMADTLIGLKNIQGAISRLEPSVSLADFIRNYYYQYSTRVKLSDAYTLNNQYKKAIETLNEAFNKSLENNKINEAKNVIPLIQNAYNDYGENQLVISKIRNDLLDSLERKIEKLKRNNQVNSNLLSEYNQAKLLIPDSLKQSFQNQIDSIVNKRYNEIVDKTGKITEQSRKLKVLIYVLILLVIMLVIAGIFLYKAYYIKKKKERELEKQKELLEKASEISQDITSKVSKDEILTEITKKIIEQLNCDHCSVFFPDLYSGKLVQYKSNSDGQSEGVSFKIGTGLVSKAYETGKTILIDNVYENEDFVKTHEKKTEYKSMLLVPINTINRTIAVICSDQDEKAYFNKSHRFFVELIANQVANDFERTSSFELLHEIEQKILNLKKSHGIKELLKDIVFGAIRLTNTSGGVIYLFSKDEKEVIDKSFYPENDFYNPLPRLDNDDSITVEIIKTKKIKIIADLLKEERVNPITQKYYRSQIGIPLLFEEKVIGVLYLEDKKQRNFSEHEISLLRTLVGQATIAIVNVKAYKESNNQKELLEKASEIGNDIGARSSRYKIFAEMAKQITVQLACRKCSIFFPNKEKKILLQYDPLNKKYEKESSFKINKGLIGEVFISGKTVLEKDVYSNKHFIVKKDDLRKQRSMLLVPVKSRNRSIAVICADHDEYGYFTESDQYFVEVIASQVASGIDRANGNEIIQNIINQILNLKKTLDVNVILRHILKGAIQLTNSTTGIIYLISDKANTIIDSYIPLDGFNHPAPRLENPNGLTRQILNTHEFISIKNIKLDLRTNPVLKDTFESMIGVPMLFENEVKGVLFLMDGFEHDYNETEISLLQTLVGEAAIAVVNAKSYEELNNQKEFLKRLVDTIPTPIFYIDKETGKYAECNDEFAKIMAYSSKEEIIGKSESELYNPERASLFKKRNLELFNKPNEPQSFEDTFYVNGRDRIFKTIKECTFSSNGEVLGLIGVLWDITEEKEMLEYKKSLLSEIEHEYKTPLAAMKSSIELLEDYLTDADSNIIKHLIKIKHNIDASIKLFEENIKFEPISSNLFKEISEIIKDIITREKVSQNISLVCADKLKTMPLDMRLIRTIIENLISNAIKYSKSEKDNIQLSINYTLNNAIITIIDEGIGIPEEAKNKIFNHKYRGTNIGERKGYGIGLAIVKQRVLLHEGTIDYQSKENEGTTFIITLPIIYANRKN